MMFNTNTLKKKFLNLIEYLKKTINEFQLISVKKNDEKQYNIAI
jgi:hypothetical protein